MGEERNKSDDGVICKELSPGLWKVSVRFRGADYLLLGVYNSEAWARQVGQQFLQQKCGSGGSSIQDA